MPANSVVGLPVPSAPKRPRGRPKHPTALPPWLLRYVQYTCLLPGKLKPAEQVLKATEFAGHPVSYGHLRNLRSKHLQTLTEFRTMLEKESWAQAAKRRLEALALDGVDVLHASVEAVKAKLMVAVPGSVPNEDIITALKVVEPILDRAVPRKEQIPVATQINITLSPRQQEALAALDTPAVEVLDAEVLPAAS